MRITMLVSNSYRPDPRVAKEAVGLSTAHHEVKIIAWDRLAQYPPMEYRDGYQVERVQDVRTTYGAGIRQLLYTPRFWAKVARRIRSSPADVIHCHDLDTLPVGWWLKVSTGVKLVYDAHEHYPAMMSLYLPRFLVYGLTLLERFLLRGVDCVITASSVLADQLSSRGIQCLATIGNYQDLILFDSIQDDEVKQARAKLGLSERDFVVAYIGGFSRNRLLLPLIRAVKNMRDVQVLIWGDGHQRREIEAESEQIANVRYLGWLPEEQVPLYTCMADVIYYCLTPNYPGAVFNAPNTLSNAMAAGRPLIANDVGDLGKIIHQTGCGLLLLDVNPVTIRQAIEELRIVETRYQMGQAGRRYAESEYNWQAAENLLINLYSTLQE